jgi:hypothetical protein
MKRAIIGAILILGGMLNAAHADGWSSGVHQQQQIIIDNR